MTEELTISQEILEERYNLAVERIRSIREESFGRKELKQYFDRAAAFLLLLDDTGKFLAGGGLEKASLEELQKRNHALYADVLPDHYEESYGNPAYAVRRLGKEYGGLLSHLYYRLRGLIGAVYENRREDLTIGLELFLEVYTAFTYAEAEGGGLPDPAEIRDILYWHVSDNADRDEENWVRNSVSPENRFCTDIVMHSDLSDVRYLYAYGKYVSENELEMARYMASLPEETIATMADTYTEGYRIGFEVTGKDLSKKKAAGVYYHMGFERMIRRAVENLAKLNLKPVISSGVVEGGTVNRQYGYDHRDDNSLFLDRRYVNRRLEALHTGFEKYKAAAGDYAGPAVVETFGEADFNPVNKAENLKLDEEQNKLWVEFRTKLNELKRQYIIEEERSFTIISFPVPEVGPVFRELFDETVRLNTLDYMLYRNVQQKLIDALDTADYCEVKGCGDNRTDLKVNLWKLQNPEKETIFENCVADVNIPVGEVFTSPVLEGTEGTLHVTRVFLNGLEYRDLCLTFEDGMIRDYTCGNFETEEENRSFVKENILFRHETLPIGEFAIGTNTTAYVMARRLGVEAKLPILIAEKTGPHFAVGDTCYEGTEDVRVYNPDGKEIVAKENSRSARRKENPEEAYFNCHTDITIPYDELGELTAVRKDGVRIPIIRDGRFVLAGTELLNEAFEK
ncbi:MAG: aminopeptidase [Butyrivibrio sp.]|nr:aminopeptidase [Acetatifactor muris]MCM1560696.1 aminopeptidase [Butyrivibrio sp.]